MNWPGGGDIYYNTSSNARRGYYNISSIPMAELDGAGQACTNWSAVIPSLLNSPAPISIALTGSYDAGAHKVCLKATVHCESAMTGADHKIYFCLTEDDLYANGRHYNRVCRLVSASGNGMVFEISPGQTRLVTYEFTLDPSWVTSKMSASCWVQTFATKEVQNSKQMAFSEIPAGVSVEPASLGNIKATYR
jgi:hypothetical protein